MLQSRAKPNALTQLSDSHCKNYFHHIQLARIAFPDGSNHQKLIIFSRHFALFPCPVLSFLSVSGRVSNRHFRSSITTVAINDIVCSNLVPTCNCHEHTSSSRKITCKNYLLTSQSDCSQTVNFPFVQLSRLSLAIHQVRAIQIVE